jgi:hypothetical protein
MFSRSRDALCAGAYLQAMKGHESSALRTDLRQKAQAVGAGTVTICALSHEM